MAELSDSDPGIQFKNQNKMSLTVESANQDCESANQDHESAKGYNHTRQALNLENINKSSHNIQVKGDVLIPPSVKNDDIAVQEKRQGTLAFKEGRVTERVEAIVERDGEKIEFSDNVSQLRDKLEVAHQIARKKLNYSAQRQKKYYDDKVKVRGPFVETFCIEKDSYIDAI